MVFLFKKKGPLVQRLARKTLKYFFFRHHKKNMNVLRRTGPITNDNWFSIMKKCGYSQEDIKDLWHLPRCNIVARKQDLSENEKRLIMMMETDDIEFFESLNGNPEYLERLTKIERVVLYLMNGNYGYVFVPAYGHKQGNIFMVRLKG